MSGLEILIVCSVLGGLLGITFRDKKRKPWVGFVVGAIGSAITTFILVQTVFQSYLAMPVYSILGSWLFSLIFKKVDNKSEASD